MKVTFIERTPGTWRLRIEHGVSPEGQRLFKYETLKGTLDDVQRRRYAILNDHEEGTFAAPAKVTFGAFFAHWIETRRTLDKITRSTAENYTKVLTYWLEPIAGKRLQRITAQDVQAIYTSLIRRGEVSAGTVFHVHRVVSAAFHAARKSGLLKVNVMDEVEAPKQPRSKPKAISEAEVVRLLKTLEGSWMEPIVALCLATGLRRGECLGLHWLDIDLTASRIHVRGQLVQYRNGEVAWTPPKTSAGLRTVAVGSEVVDMLRRLRVAAAERRVALGAGGKLDDAYVFTREDEPDRPVDPAKLTIQFTKHCMRHGFGDVSFHATRHTHITSLLARVGKSGAKAVSQRVGHSDLSITLGIYQTVFEDDDRALADLSSSIFSRR